MRQKLIFLSQSRNYTRVVELLFFFSDSTKPKICLSFLPHILVFEDFFDVQSWLKEKKSAFIIPLPASKMLAIVIFCLTLSIYCNFLAVCHSHFDLCHQKPAVFSLCIFCTSHIDIV